MDTKNDADLLVKTTLKELIVYAFFLTLVCIITFCMTNPVNFYFTNALMNLFQTTPTSSGMYFSNMNTVQDFWDVYTGPILNSFYWEKWYNGKNASQYDYVYFESKLLGVPRLRQIRVQNGSCAVQSLFKNTIYSCFAPYSRSVESKQPFGLYLNNQSNMVDTAWFYQDSSQLNSAAVTGLLGTYSGGGFVKDLGTNLADSVAIMNDLMTNTWIDRATRAVFLDFTLYNGNINMFCQIRLISEFPATGGVVPSSLFRTVKLIRYVTPLDYFVLICECLFSLLIAYYTIEEIIEIYIHRWNYFKEMFNVLDLVILVISYACIGFDIYRAIAMNNTLDGLLVNTSTFPNFDSLVYWQYMFDNAMAFLAFLSWIKFFKYISFNKTMTQLSETLSRCAKDIFGFSVMFYVIFFAYAQLGYLLFGATNSDYSSFLTTLFTLFRIILGDFNFPALEATSRIIGPIYFISYVFFVFFVLLNMFLAIINESYSEVKSDIATSKSDFELVDYFKKKYQRLMNKMHMNKEQIVDIQQALDSADVDADTLVNFEEWRKELKKRGYSDTEIESYFAKYDLDGNRNLSSDEQMKMRADLKAQFNRIDEDMAKLKAEAEIEKKIAELDALDNKNNTVNYSEFKILTGRVDTMESSIGSIVDRIESVLAKLEFIEKAKLKRREAMARILEKLNDSSDVQDDIKKLQIENMIKEELEKWDEPASSTSPIGAGYSSRAASPPTSARSPVQTRVAEKKAWKQQ